ncbi:MAG TPA: FG-GAP-like repeat-containing protein [Pyrinomonadaceae bacterium]|nr:FG-GAP-like repeat-containing protein [Pyrinomonadaceae bacterium]
MLKNSSLRSVFGSCFKFSLTFLCFLLLTFQISAVVRDGQLDPNFSAYPISVGSGGIIYDFATLPDGKILVAGGISSVSAGSSNGIARLNADGSFDAAFNGKANAAVSAIFPLSDGKILISGDFSQYSNVARNRIARINSDGTLDTTFNLNFGTGYVQIVAVQPDGKMIVNGTFTAVNGTPRIRLARLNADGSLDSSFEVGGGISNAGVYRGAVLADGKILLAGSFTSYDGVPRNGILRLNSNGSLDPGFVPGIGGSSNEIFDMSLANDGKICIVGEIESANTVRRLNADGSVDSTFNIGNTWTSGRMYAVLAQPDGKVLIGGSFDSIFINSTVQYRLFRFNADGSPDSTFVGQAGSSLSSGDVRAFELQNGNKILVGGDYPQLNGLFRGGIGRLNLDSSLDTSFAGFFGSFTTPNVFCLLPDGKIYVGGNFSAIGTSFKPFFARLNSDGSADNSFSLDSRVDNSIYSIAIQPDGKILLGGYTGDDFSRIVSKGVWRINADGSLDTTFNTQIAKLETVRSIIVQPDGKILIAGAFTKVNNVARTSLARLNADGSLDTAFNPVLGGISANAIALQADGKIMVGGNFNNVGGSPVGNFARLNADGTLDSTFNTGSGANSTVNSFLITPAGKIYVGGNFFTFNGASLRSLVRLNADGSLDNKFNAQRLSSSVSSIIQLPDNKILISGAVSITFDSAPRERIIRLFENGVIDYSFDVGKMFRNGSTGGVFQTAVQPDGKILAGGSFDTVNGSTRWGLMRLNTFARVSPAFYDYEGDGKSDISVYRPGTGTWYRMNSYFNQFRAFRFGLGEDKIMPADFDGDFLTDVAVFRPAEGNWYVQNSGTGTYTTIHFGLTGDIPVAKDFDGDGKADFAVFRPSTGVWYLLQSRDGFAALQFGLSEDLPTAADFDGDGKCDIAVFRPSTGIWYIINSSNGGIVTLSFGSSSDIPVPNDFDGDYKADIAVFRPSDGVWYILQSSQGLRAFQFGIDGDKPVVADYDGDDKADIAVYRSGIWYILNSSTFTYTIANFGLSGDTALTN